MLVVETRVLVCAAGGELRERHWTLGVVSCRRLGKRYNFIDRLPFAGRGGDAWTMTGS